MKTLLIFSSENVNLATIKEIDNYEIERLKSGINDDKLFVFYKNQTLPTFDNVGNIFTENPGEPNFENIIAENNIEAKIVCYNDSKTIISYDLQNLQNNNTISQNSNKGNENESINRTVGRENHNEDTAIGERWNTNSRNGNERSGFGNTPNQTGNNEANIGTHGGDSDIIPNEQGLQSNNTEETLFNAKNYQRGGMAQSTDRNESIDNANARQMQKNLSIQRARDRFNERISSILQSEHIAESCNTILREFIRQSKRNNLQTSQIDKESNQKNSEENRLFGQFGGNIQSTGESVEYQSTSTDIRYDSSNTGFGFRDDGNDNESGNRISDDAQIISTSGENKGEVSNTSSEFPNNLQSSENGNHSNVDNEFEEETIAKTDFQQGNGDSGNNGVSSPVLQADDKGRIDNVGEQQSGAEYNIPASDNGISNSSIGEQNSINQQIDTQQGNAESAGTTMGVVESGYETKSAREDSGNQKLGDRGNGLGDVSISDDGAGKSSADDKIIQGELRGGLDATESRLNESNIAQTESKSGNDSEQTNNVSVEQEFKTFSEFEFFDTSSPDGFEYKGKIDFHLRHDERIEANIEALKLTQAIFKQNRKFATPEEQEILARYSGFGGLRNLFYEDKYAAKRNELLSIVGDKHYKSIVESGFTAYYTPYDIVKNMYDNLIYKFGVGENNRIRALEPSCGIGHFITIAPNNFYFEAVEKDTITATIAKFLHPKTRIYNKGFEEVNFDGKEFDVVIGNPPYDNEREDKELIHNYFVIKSQNLLKDGGLSSFVITSGFMDSKTNSHREKIAEENYLLLATRLPNDAFSITHTEVLSDIVFFRKTKDKEQFAKNNYLAWDFEKNTNLFLNSNEDFDNAEELPILDEIKNKEMKINHYFAENPNNILGKMSIGSREYGYVLRVAKTEPHIENFNDTISIADMDDALLRNTFNPNPGKWISEFYISSLQATPQETQKIADLRIGNVFAVNDKFYRKGDNFSCEEIYFEDEIDAKNKHILENKNFTILEQKKSKIIYKNPLNSQEKEILNKVIKFRDLLKNNIENEQKMPNDEDSNNIIMTQKNELKNLRNEILKLSNAKGFNQSRLTRKKDENGIIIQHNLKDIIDLEILENYRIYASENIKKILKGKAKEIKYEEADILQQRILFPLEKQEAKDAIEAFHFTINDKGTINEASLQGYLPNQPLKQTLKELCEAYLIFPDLDSKDSNTTKNYVLKDKFLSGNIKAKAKKLENMIENNQEFHLLDYALSTQEYLEFLKENFPKDITFDKLEISFGANFVATDIYEDFIRETFFKEPSKAIFSINRIGSDWTISDFEIKDGAFDNNFREVYDEKCSLTEEAYNLQITPQEKLSQAHHGEKFVFDLKELLERIMNNKSLEVVYKVKERNRDGDEVERKKVDTPASKNAIDAAENIKTMFGDFIFRNENYRNRIETQYNNQINVFSNNKIEFNGILQKPLLNKDIQLRPHQDNAVFKGIMNDSLLLDHQVGAGKTLCAISMIMEQKRMGLVNKALVLVPNHLSVQWGNEFIRAYPTAKLLIGDKIKSRKDRKTFLYRARNGDYDAIIMKHSTFENISVMENFEKNVIEEQIHTLKSHLIKEKENEKQGKPLNKSALQLIDRKIKRLESKLEKKAKGKVFDDEIAFEDLGIDCLVVDEAHEFKNLFIETSQFNVKGLSTTDSAKAMKMFCATQYMHDNNFKLYFLTGTPVSNSIAEFYTMQRYIQPDVLKDLKLEHYDDWQRVFARVVLSEELDSSGVNYALVNRLSKFINAPELMNLYKQNADIITNEDIEKQNGRIVPKIKGGKAINVIAPRSEDIANFIGIEDDYGHYNEGSIIWRMEHQKDDPVKNNILACTTEARKAALDYRLIDPQASDYEDSKINKLTEYVLHHYNDKQYDKGTQLIFCDLGVSKVHSQKINTEIRDSEKFETIDEIAERLGLEFIIETDEDDNETESYWVAYKKDENGNILVKKDRYGDEIKIIDKKYTWFDLQEHQSKFNVYGEILKKLVKAGIPQKEIAFIGDAKNEAQKADLFKKVNAGDVRILIGSTSKMGVGTNVQERIIAFHELDCPWRPCDLEQRAGRAIRQGNMFFEKDKENFEIAHYRYATEQTYDSRMFQINEQKLLPLSQMKKVNNLDSERVFDAVDMEMANVAEMKAVATGNPFILEQHHIDNLLDTEEKRFKSFKSKIVNVEKDLIRSEIFVKELETDLESLNDLEKNNIFSQDDFEFEVMGIKTFKKNDSKEIKAKIEAKLYDIEAHPDEYNKQGKKINVLSANGITLLLKVTQYNKKDDVYSIYGIVESDNKLYSKFSNLQWQIDKFKTLGYERKLKVDGILTRLKNAFEKIPHYKEETKKDIESTNERIASKKAFLERNKYENYPRRFLLETLKQDKRNMNEIRRIRNEKIKVGKKIDFKSPEIKDFLPKYKELLDENGNFAPKDSQKVVETAKAIKIEEEKIVTNIAPQTPEVELVSANNVMPSQNERHNRMMFSKRNETAEQNAIKDFESSAPLLEKIKILEENNQSLNNKQRAKDILEPRTARKYLPSSMIHRQDRIEKQEEKTNDKTK